MGNRGYSRGGGQEEGVQLQWMQQRRRTGEGRWLWQRLRGRVEGCTRGGGQEAAAGAGGAGQGGRHSRQEGGGREEQQVSFEGCGGGGWKWQEHEGEARDIHLRKPQQVSDEGSGKHV